MSGVDEMDPLERDVELAWELFEVQPSHPEVGRLASRVLAQQPGRNGIRMLLAMHRQQCGDADEARRLLLDILGQRDQYFVNAARTLRDLEQHENQFVEARRWAEVVLQEDQEGWHDLMELGVASAMSGDMERGWQMLDEAVAQCARTEESELRYALAGRAIYLFQSFAPSERFIVAAEEAIRADPSSDTVVGPLMWAYVHQGRFDDAQELALRTLRQDPMDGLAGGVITMLRELREVTAKQDITMADLHQAGAVEAVWVQMRDQILGIDLQAALAALDEVLPDDLRAALRPPLDEEAARESGGESDVLAWHDGQEPGTGALWQTGGDFRLMSAAEIGAMDDAVEADPVAWSQWTQESLDDYYVQILTDDADGYIITTMHEVVLRRQGSEDVVIAPSLSGWFWDRVRAFGGRDPRPLSQREEAAQPANPAPPTVAEIDALNAEYLAAPEDQDRQIRFWQAVVALDRWYLINRGTEDAPRPFALQTGEGPLVCLYTSEERAGAAAEANGLVPPGETVPLFSMPLPAAIDWVLSLGEHGLAGVIVDHPQIGAWCPLPNLVHLGRMRWQS
ncbi:hypothetical protein [Aeromicrobium sp. Leaf350]|uniref:hypothetical protein n=1 Tax=Aeromicrobium sp. Leaf350 TaxID=2876565 RepID=UPI001E5B29C8|nr:hypothetical protein [Aeromicrobium sp. Leaf350]